MSTELAERVDLPVKSDPYRLMTIAVERGADVAQLSALMDLQQRYDAEQARKAFYAAKGKFQSICPVIKHDKKVEYGKTSYTHASLGSIAEQIREPLRQCLLSYRWDIQKDEGNLLRVTCYLSHDDGHSESTYMFAEPDDSGAKNAIQQSASTVTYLQRYTLIGVLGLTTANEDDDGRSSGALNVETLRAHNDVVRNMFHSVYIIKQAIADKDYEIAAEAWSEFTEDEQRAIWVAPSKGGVFTTAEREAMKSDEWAAARRAYVADKAAAE